MATGRLPHHRISGQSALGCLHARGLTVLEMCAFVSVVAVVLSGMVSLARHVKSRGAEVLTRERIELLSRRVRSAWDDPTLAEPLPRSMNEPDLLAWAKRSSERLVRVFTHTDATIRPELFFDAWGTPIALVDGGGRQLGIPLDDRPFLISAGADRQFLSTGDNFYSYDLVGASVTTEHPGVIRD